MTNKELEIYGEDERLIHAICPSCEYTPSGFRTATLVINKDTLRAECTECGHIIEPDDLRPLLSPEIKNEASPAGSPSPIQRREHNPSTPILTTINAKELLTMTIKETQWIVQDLIPVQGITALSSSPYQGKTWLTLLVAKAVASGEPLLEHFAVRQGGVLFVDKENDLQNIILPRLRMLDLGDLPIEWVCNEEFSVDRPNYTEALIEKAKEINASLVVFDSLIRIHGGDENAATSMAKVFSAMKKMASEGISVLFAHHNRKEMVGMASDPAQSMRGSSDILAAVDVHLSLKKANEDGDLIIQQTKNRPAKLIDPFGIKFLSQDDHVKFTYQGKVDPDGGKVAEVMSAIADLLEKEREELNQGQIKDKLGKFKGALIKVALDRLEEEKIVMKRVGPHNQHLYRLNEDAPLF